MKKWFAELAVFAAILVGAFWWLLLDGRAPESADNIFDIVSYRAMVAEDAGQRPTALHIEIAGTDVAPGFAAEVGNFGSDYAAAYTSLQLVWPDQSIVIGGAVDQQTATEIQQSAEQSHFDTAAYTRITDAMTKAEQVLLTHEHLDHVIAIARHPDPAALAPRLQLNAKQLSALPPFAIDGKLAPEIAGTKPIVFDKARRIAPGVVVIPTAGHTPGNQSFFIQLEDGTEYLLIGDIVWVMTNIDNLKTRPRILQYILFDPDEQRDVVLEQVRALHDLKRAEPNLVLVNSHDRLYLESLIQNKKLVSGFIEPVAANGPKKENSQ